LEASVTVNFAKYGLRDNPFVSGPVVRIDSTDERINGKLYCKELAEEQLKKFHKLVSLEKIAIYVNADKEVLGTGKSALMAAAYWEMVAANTKAVWVEATGGITINSILGKIVDTLVVRKYIAKIKETIDVTSTDELKQALLQKTTLPSDAKIDAVKRILSMPDEQIPWKYSNIRRSIPMYSLTDVFGAILNILFSVDGSHFFFFIDQFEEYIIASSRGARLNQMGNDLNDLFRALQGQATLVVSLHPAAESLFQSAAGDYVQSLAPVKQNSIFVPKLDGPMTARMVRYYLDAFRSRDSNHTGTVFPFSNKAIESLTEELDYNPRDVINALRTALTLGVEAGKVPIDWDFINSPDNRDLIIG